MGHWWRYALRIIAIIAAAAPAVMNVAGCLVSFTDPVIKYGAEGVGVCADIYLFASVPAFADLRQKKREWAFKAGIAIWLACAVWTGLSSAKWLEHALEAAQAPVEQQEKTQAQTERERQDNLARERALLGKQDDAALNGKTKEVRDNAVKLAAETRTRIAGLEKQNTFSAKTEPTPIKSPFAGYEKLVTFLLLAFSQGCWFMALDEEPAEAAVAEIGAARKPERAEISSENDAPVPPESQRKRAGNGRRKSTGTTPGNAEGAQILQFRKRPTKEEISALKASGKSIKEIAANFRYSERQIRNIYNGISGSEMCQATG